TATGAFMQITSTQDARLIGASSPAAASVGVHEMSMQGNVMKMQPVAGGLALPAGKPVTLKPGSYHIMMEGLKGQIKAGDTVPMTLVVEDKNHQRQNVEVKITAQPISATGPAAGGMQGMPGMSGDHSMHH
ncbi:MAG TPA: copper chaperone PCu(A)C, partial [Burkholderiales bacterium]